MTTEAAIEFWNNVMETSPLLRGAAIVNNLPTFIGPLPQSFEELVSLAGNPQSGEKYRLMLKQYKTREEFLAEKLDMMEKVGRLQKFMSEWSAGLSVSYSG
jgi:hypothetical protein